ncbi:LppU/SCO3897 family protein [Streptomyces sp. NPDC002402]
MATPQPPHGTGPHAWPSQPVGPYASSPGPYVAPPQANSFPPPHGAYASPYPPGAYAPQAGVPACHICGALPAVPATVRGHQGIVVVMRFLSLRGPFCRDCGLSTVRDMSAKTLWQGWWGPLSVVITPITLLANLAPWGRFRKLAAPAGGFRSALAPGRPLTRRPEALVFLVPMLLVAVAIPALIVTGVLVGDGSAPTLPVGACVRNEGDWADQDLQVTDCGAPSAQYKVTHRLEKAGSTCAGGDYLADPKYGPDGATISCLEPLH